METKWPDSAYPFERIHLDFFHLKGKNFLLIVDSFSKYIQIYILKTYTAAVVIERLTQFFALYGICKILVSDNGPPFNSSVFIAFCREHNIECLKSPAYHPQSNGLAERNVQTAKKALNRFNMGNDHDIQYQVNKYLLHSRHTPSSTTGRTPAELIFSYKQKTMLDILNDKIVNENSNITFNFRKMNKSKKLEKNVNENKNSNETNKKFSKNNVEFKINDKIMYKNHFKDWVKWMPATIKQCLSNLRYLIDVNGQVRYVHVNQIRKIQIEDTSFFHQKLYVPFDKKEKPENKRSIEIDSNKNLVKRRSWDTEHFQKVRQQTKKLNVKKEIIRLRRSSRIRNRSKKI